MRSNFAFSTWSIPSMVYLTATPFNTLTPQGYDAKTVTVSLLSKKPTSWNINQSEPQVQIFTLLVTLHSVSPYWDFMVSRRGPWQFHRTHRGPCMVKTWPPVEKLRSSYSEFHQWPSVVNQWKTPGHRWKTSDHRWNWQFLKWQLCLFCY